MKEIVFILDRSGSMNARVDDVIGGFNSFLKEQKEIKDKAKLTVILFDDRYEVLHDGVEIHEVPFLTKKEYYARNSTSLLDAIGKTITTLKNQVSKRDKILIFINTDGYENSSVEFNTHTIKAMVTEMKKEYGWKFVFLGANMDAISTARNYGISISGNFSQSSDGYASVYAVTSNMIRHFRESESGNLDINTLNDLK